MPKYTLVEDAAKHCWSNNFLEVFREFFADHAAAFFDAPIEIAGEQNLEYYSLFQRYLKLYENTLQGYIESLDATPEEFYRQVAAVKNDPEIKDKKLLHFANYLIACTDYESFYKVMVRAAKKVQKQQSESKSESKSEGKTSYEDRDSKGSGSDEKRSYK
eukprot:gene9193-12399_t